MIATIIIIGLALSWLAYETDYLRIRLLVGPWIVPLIYKRDTWENISRNLKPNPVPFWWKHPYNMEPLCGREWLENHQHVLPEYKIVLDFGTIRHTINVCPGNEQLLNNVVKINTRKHRVKWLPVGKSLGNEPTNPNWIKARLAELEYTPEKETAGVA